MANMRFLNFTEFFFIKQFFGINNYYLPFKLTVTDTDDKKAFYRTSDDIFVKMNEY